MLLAVFVVATGASSPASAVPAKAVQEAVEYVSKKFAAEVGQESAETLSAKLTNLAARHGDEAVAAFRKVGPRAFRVAEEAGEHAGAAVKLMARHGDEALWVLRDPQRMTLLAKYGDEAAEAMIRHKGVAASLIEQFHAPAAKALNALDGQNARRLAMLADEGTLAKLGRTDALMAVIEKNGNRAADFVWRNKGSLTVAAALTAFLYDPQPFIDGTRNLATVAGQPVADAVKETARQSALHTNWTAVWITALVIAALLIILRARRARHVVR
jgi:hypothetical protein